MDHIDHVLIVDDDRDIRELVSSYLRRNGLRVTLAADGRQMRSFLERDRVDLIVLDIMMPGDDGLVLCRELRAGRHKATPVLMLTARSDETDRIVGLEMGADDYLVKPFAARELLARIKAVLRRTRMLPPNLQVTEAGRLLAFGAWQLDTTTRHLIDARALEAMRPSAVLVNIARGPVVDERALVDALRAGTIAGAALDVFEREPEVEEGLLDLENVVLTPHLGSATRATRVAMGMLCVEALRAVLLEGRRPRNVVG